MPIAPLLLLAFVFGAAHAAAPRTGTFELTISERSPLSSSEEMHQRIGRGDPDYDVAAEPYDVYVPASYDGTVAYGLIAYINSGQGGHAPQYRPVCDARRLIWVGHTRVQNERATAHRMGLTIDAVHYLQKHYRIDPDRIYVSGNSGGGRVASLVAIPYTDVFSGGAIYIIGCNPMIWPGDKALRDQAQSLAPQRRFSFLTGSEDFNKPGTINVHAAYVAAKFPYAEYLEVPGMAHDQPPVEWFDKAVAFNDAPLAERAAQALARGEELTAKKPVEAYAALQQAAANVAVAPEVAAKAATLLEPLTVRIDTDLSSELDGMLAGRPTGPRLRAFAEKWADFPSAARAREQANVLGQADLETILARTGPMQARALRQFVSDWQSYPVAEQAMPTLDALARTAYEPIAAQPAARRGKALLKFISDWSPASTTVEAAALLDGDLASELDGILALDRPAQRAQRLQSFAKQWQGRPAGDAAEAEFKRMVADAQAAQKP